MKIDKINIKSVFKDDYITRVAGEKLRNMILKSVSENKKVELDFTDLMVASTSFFDEAIAKLVDHGWNRDKFNERVHFKNLHPKDKIVMEKMCSYRGLREQATLNEKKN